MKEDAPRTSSRWFLATLPLAPLALFAYGAFEWLFFVTKPSVLSVLPLGERILAIAQVAIPVLPAVFVAQLVASAISLVFFPRIRILALVPAAAVLAALILILTDNFLYALFRMTAAASESISRLIYAAIVIIAFGVWLRMLNTELWARARRQTVFILWIVCGLVAATGSAASWFQSRAVAKAELPAIPTARRPNILLLSIDGIDAKQMSAYGHERPTSPFLLSIRDETLFGENAFSNGAQTYTSLTSMLTGRLPFATKVIVPQAMLKGRAAFQHLPGIARRSGYRTMQLTMRHFADAEDANLQGGFESANYRWENRLSTSGVQDLYDSPRAFRLAAVDRLNARLGRIIGTSGPSRDYAHIIGAAEDPFWSDARRLRTLFSFFDAGDQPWLAHVHLLDSHSGQVHEEERQSDPTLSPYGNAIREADANVQRIFEALRKRNELDRTIVVITSDHGGGWDTTDRVPLMIRFPGGRAARREHANVALIDIAPTILDFVGVTPPRWMDGVSLLRSDSIPSNRVILAVASSGSSPSTSRLGIDVPRPPNHGARTVSAIAGSWWYVLDLGQGTLTSGAIDGHTRPTPRMSDVAARQMIVRLLAENSFRVTDTPPAKDEARAASKP